MYISGSKFNFENRLHQLSVNTGDFNQYHIEGSGYINSINLHFINKWNREFNHVYFEMTKTHIIPLKLS